uniref:Reverse transcriptase/retrotransposon-derived protein RNase H-like domain-containing protein n=1 Tax=Cajanus cajan TaxID=3821 RepID=A0A151S1G9_CAJCA|nr:hypothetical protein KK1_029643 [Cajanus cajan]
MRLNPDKCVFGVQGGKFLGFMITCRGIEANPDKCQALINMRSPKNHKEPKEFCWSDQCEQAFTNFKQFLSSPPILSKPNGQADSYYILQ